jgi:hypothetical protein
MRAVLDHAVIDVRDALDAAAVSLERLGFQVTPPSENSLGSINRLCVFGSTYLEALAVGPRAAGEQRNRMTGPIGGNGLVFHTEDAEATAAALRERGIATGEVRAFSRSVHVDGASADARFETVHAQIPDAAPLRTYFCRHLTPELVWRSGWKSHPNGALDIVAVTVAARHPKAFGAWLSQAFDGVPGWIGVHAEKSGERAAAITTLTIATANRQAAERIVRANALPMADVPGRLIVLPQPAINVAVEFV